MVWYDTFDDAFWLAIVPMILGVVAIAVKSKCSRCSFCGIEIERDIVAEIAVETAGRNASLTRQNSRNSLNDIQLNESSTSGVNRSAV